jgi:beta-lactamase class A
LSRTISDSNLVDLIVDSCSRSSLSLVVESPPGQPFLSLNSNKILHAASLMKLPIMATVFRLNREKKLNLHDQVAVINSFPSLTSSKFFSINQSLPDPDYQIIDLVKLMIIRSDNQATNVLINLIGFPQITETLRLWSLNNTRIIRMIMDEDAFSKGLNNVTSAEDIATFFRKLWTGTGLEKEDKDQMIAILKKQAVNNRIPSALPPGIEIAHKTGSITGHCYDGGIIYTRPPLLLVIMVYNSESGVSIIHKITANILKVLNKTS